MFGFIKHTTYHTLDQWFSTFFSHGTLLKYGKSPWITKQTLQCRAIFFIVVIIYPPNTDIDIVTLGTGHMRLHLEPLGG